MHASYSSINSYNRCGEAYRLTKEEQVKEVPAWWLPGGSAVHQATELYDMEEDFLKGSFPFQEVFEQKFKANDPRKDHRFLDVEPRAAGRGNSKQDDKWWLANGAAMAQAWADWQDSSGWQVATLAFPDGDTRLAVEVDATTELEGYLVKAYIDRIMVNPDGELVIVDLKTGARQPDSPLQLGFYRALLLTKWGIDIPLGGYFMNRKAVIPEVHRLDKYTPEYVGRYVRQFMQAREAGIFMPNPGQACRTCGVAHACWVVNGLEQQSTDGNINHTAATIREG